MWYTLRLWLYSDTYIYALAMLFVIAIPFAMFFRRMFFSGKTDSFTCPQCEYNLTALRATTCPECGSDLHVVGVMPPGKLGARIALLGLVWTLWFLSISIAAWPFVKNKFIRTIDYAQFRLSRPDSGLYQGVSIESHQTHTVFGRFESCDFTLNIHFPDRAGSTMIINPRAQTYRLLGSDAATGNIDFSSVGATGAVQKWMEASGVHGSAQLLQPEFDAIAKAFCRPDFFKTVEEIEHLGWSISGSGLGMPFHGVLAGTHYARDTLSWINTDVFLVCLPTWAIGMLFVLFVARRRRKRMRVAFSEFKLVENSHTRLR
jgi:hypothetical protein